MKGTEVLTIEEWRNLRKSKPGQKREKGQAHPQLDKIKADLHYGGIPYVEEYEFALEAGRKFRFDVAFPEHKIAIEYEGIYSGKSRHTTASGYTEDTEKYNLAQELGWIVLRFTAKNYEAAATRVRKIIEKRNANR